MIDPSIEWATVEDVQPGQAGVLDEDQRVLLVAPSESGARFCVVDDPTTGTYYRRGESFAAVGGFEACGTAVTPTEAGW